MIGTIPLDRTLFPSTLSKSHGARIATLNSPFATPVSKPCPSNRVHAHLSMPWIGGADLDQTSTSAKNRLPHTNQRRQSPLRPIYAGEAEDRPNLKTPRPGSRDSLVDSRRAAASPRTSIRREFPRRGRQSSTKDEQRTVGVEDVAVRRRWRAG